MINSWYPAAPEITDKDSCSFTLTFSRKCFFLFRQPRNSENSIKESKRDYALDKYVIIIFTIRTIGFNKMFYTLQNFSRKFSIKNR